MILRAYQNANLRSISLPLGNDYCGWSQMASILLRTHRQT
nr:MAG TPA: hypothetical protein [Caudoviricetes sp.]